MPVLRLRAVVLGGAVPTAGGLVEVDEPPIEARHGPVVVTAPPTAEARVPGTGVYRWSEVRVRAAVRDDLAPLDARPAPVGATVWTPPSYPDVDGDAPPPVIGRWTPGGWLVETPVGRCWVVEAYGRVSPADDLASRCDVRLGCAPIGCP